MDQPHQGHDTRLLKRELGVPTAALLGLGSILGTGVFVSIGLGASIAGGGIVWAIIIAGVVAMCNGLSSAQLAANHPVAGGTYEYGYRFLTPSLGFLAGWMFLCAKSASAAAAAIGFAGYVLRLFDVASHWLTVGVALASIIALTAVVIGGIRRSAITNIVLVGVVLLTLGIFIVVGFVTGVQEGRLVPSLLVDVGGDAGSPALETVLWAAALMFVAYTGYGRVATLGEEVRNPERTIPRAIIVTLIISAVVYVLTAVACLAAVGVDAFTAIGASSTAPLEAVAQALEQPWLAITLAVGASVAMLSVMLNLILGLSRVLLAMGRRRDMPHLFARVNRAQSTPWIAVVIASVLIAGIALIGDFRIAWSFSAFTVLVYYAITNVAAIMLTPEERFLPRAVSVAGLVGCLGLALFVERTTLVAGLALLFVGVIWHFVAQSFTKRPGDMIGT